MTLESKILQKPQNYPMALLAEAALEGSDMTSIDETPQSDFVELHTIWGRNKRITITRYNRDVEENYKTCETDTALGQMFEFRQAVEREIFIIDKDGRVHRDTQ